MSNIYVSNNVSQLTSLGSLRYNFYVGSSVIQSTSQACIVDITPPSFAGIQSLIIGTKGELNAEWLAGTDPQSPIRYAVYIQEFTNVGLFHPLNLLAQTNKLKYSIFNTPDGAILKSGSTYHVGVRAIDGIGNQETNTISISILSPGLNFAAENFSPKGVFSLGQDNKVYGNFWILKNEEVVSGAQLGLGKYEIFDKSGTLKLSQASISANSDGIFTITPIASTLNTTLEHYLIKLSIYVNGVLRVGYVSVVEQVPEYEVHGSFAINPNHELVASFWALANEELVTTPSRLGTASYTVYDQNGSVVVGMSQSGITPDSNGLFKITPVASILQLDLSLYSVKVTIGVDSANRTSFLPILGRIPRYESHGVFSIDALNRIQGTLWATVDGMSKSGSGLGTASCTIYDKDGVPVSGLSQTGLVANGDGKFFFLPTSAALITDLTHYGIKISIVVDGVERTSDMGISLLGA